MSQPVEGNILLRLQSWHCCYCCWMSQTLCAPSSAFKTNLLLFFDHTTGKWVNCKTPKRTPWWVTQGWIVLLAASFTASHINTCSSWKILKGVELSTSSGLVGLRMTFTLEPPGFRKYCQLANSEWPTAGYWGISYPCVHVEQYRGMFLGDHCLLAPTGNLVFENWNWQSWTSSGLTSLLCGFFPLGNVWFNSGCKGLVI
jgi:hypothetical protein